MPPRKVRRVAPPVTEFPHPDEMVQGDPVVIADGTRLDFSLIPQTERAPTEPPRDWIKGQLLNVRNRGDAYVITLHPEEFDERHPERAMRFTNLGECQGFVSRWYAAEHHDPRAR
jgi:hypothetical protein